MLNRPRPQLSEPSSKLWWDPAVCHDVLRVVSGRHDIDKRGANDRLDYNIILQRTSRARSAVIVTDVMRLDAIRLDCCLAARLHFLLVGRTDKICPNLVLDSRRNNSSLIAFF